MSEIEEVTMTFIPLVKRDHRRWSTNKCKLEAGKLAKKCIAELKASTRTDWSRVERVNPKWDIISKRLQVS